MPIIILLLFAPIDAYTQSKNQIDSIVVRLIPWHLMPPAVNSLDMKGLPFGHGQKGVDEYVYSKSTMMSKRLGYDY